MGINYYAETQGIIDALVDEGLVSESRALRDVMEAGATGTEILMGIRWQLQQIDASNSTTNLDTKRRIRALVGALNHELS